MRAYSYSKAGNPSEVLEFSSDFPTPKPSPTEVLIDVMATALNPVDWKMMKGSIANILQQKPFIPSFDMAGKIIEVGSKVKKFKIGDEVYGMASFMRCGGLAEFATMDESLLSLKPLNLTFIEAAAVPMGAMTSWQCLVETAKIDSKPDQKVLIKGGSGGVGSFGIQIAKYFGAEVTVTCSQRNAELCKSLGADNVIDYTKSDPTIPPTPNYYDIIYDTIGGAELYEASSTLMRQGGTYVSIVGDTPDGLDNFGATIRHGMKMGWRGFLGLIGAGVKYSVITCRANGKDLEQIKEVIEKGKIKPVIDSTFTFENAREAFEKLMSSRASGKIVVTVKNH